MGVGGVVVRLQVHLGTHEKYSSKHATQQREMKIDLLWKSRKILWCVFLQPPARWVDYDQCVCVGMVDSVNHYTIP